MPDKTTNKNVPEAGGSNRYTGKLRRWGGRLMKVALLFLLLVAVLLLFLTSPAGENLIRRTAQAQLSSALGQRVEIGALETNLLTRLVLEEVLLAPPDTIAPTLLRLKHARITYRPWDLLRQRLTLSTITLKGLQITVARDSSGLVNVPDVGGEETEEPAKDEAGGGFQIFLGEATLNDGELRYYDRTLPLASGARNLDLTIEGRDISNYRVKLAIDSGSVISEEWKIPLQALRLWGRWQRSAAFLDSLWLSFSGLRFYAEGEANFSVNPTPLQGSWQLQGPPGQLLREFLEMPDSLWAIRGELVARGSLEGTLENPVIPASVQLPDARISRVWARQGELQATWRPEALQVQRFHFALLDGKVVGQGKVQLDSSLGHDLQLKIRRLQPGRWWQIDTSQALRWSSLLNADLQTRGPLADYAALIGKGTLSLKPAGRDSLTVTPLKATLEYRDGKGTLALRQDRNALAAEIAIRRDSLAGTLSLTFPALKELGKLAELPGLQGKLTGRGNFSGPLDTLRAEAVFSGSDIRYRGFPVDRFRGDIGYRDSVLHIDRLTFGGRVTRFDSLRPLFDLPELHGGLAYRGSVRGTLQNWQGGALIRLHQPGYGEYGFSAGEAAVELDRQNVYLTAVRLWKKTQLLAGRGEMGIDSLQGNLRLGLKTVESAPESLAEEFLSLPGQIPPVALDTLPGGRLWLSFAIADSADYRASLRGENLKVAQLTNLYSDTLRIAGELALQAGWRGSVQRPRAWARWRIDAPQFQQVQFDSLTGGAVYRPPLARLDSLKVFYETHQSLARGQIGLQKGEEGGWTVSDSSGVKGSLRGNQFDLQTLSPWLPPEMKLSGTGNYRLTLTGELGNPRVKGYVRLRDGSTTLNPNTPPLSDLQVDIAARDTIFTVERFDGRLGEVSFALRGEVLTERWQRFRQQFRLLVEGEEVITSEGRLSPDSLRMRLAVTDFNLHLAQTFIPHLQDLRGLVNARIRAAGTPESPQVDGELTAGGVEMQLEPELLQERLTAGRLKVRFNRDRVTLDSLFFRLNGGNGLVTGDLAYSAGEFSEFDFRGRARNIQIEQPDVYLFTLNSAHLEYYQQGGNFLLDGDIRLGETRFLYDFKLTDVLSFKKEVEEPAAEPPKILQKTRLDVRLRDSNQLWIDNNLARLRLRTELSLVGNPLQPGITGRVSAEEGYVLYLDRKFDLQRGAIDFVDPNQINPYIDLLATTSVTSYSRQQGTTYNIQISASGPLEELEIEITSTPELEQSDIAALLTVGATRAQLTGEGESQADVSEVLTERVEVLSSRVISGYASRQLGDFLGVDSVGIRGNLFDVGEETGPEIVASKKISDRAKVTYSTAVGHLNEQKIRLDYQLSKYFYIQGEADQEGESSIGIKYKLKF